MNCPATPILPASECSPANCRWRCALEVTDELLRQRGAASGVETDLLLDLRWKLRKREDAEGVLRLFCDLRLRMERRHYLAFFRIRRWLENHLLAEVRICPAAEAHVAPVRLDYYCVEAIRRSSLCAALGRGAVLILPRLEFKFHRHAQPAAAPVAAPVAAEASAEAARH